MQSVLIIECFICKVSLFIGALYAQCSYVLVLYMQSVLLFWCYILCIASLWLGALYAKCVWVILGAITDDYKRRSKVYVSDFVDGCALPYAYHIAFSSPVSPMVADHSPSLVHGGAVSTHKRYRCFHLPMLRIKTRLFVVVPLSST